MNTEMYEKHTAEQPLPRVSLATRMRPKTFYGYIGQKHLLGKGRVLQRAIESKHVPSMIFWGPPGCGKTSLANVIAFNINAHFTSINAAMTNAAELKIVFNEATERFRTNSRKTILFIENIHLLNKSLQEVLRPFLHNGIIIFIGATTENPLYETTSPLFSRIRIIPLQPLSNEEISTIILRATTDKLQGIGDLNVVLEEDALENLVKISNNNARLALDTLETSALSTPTDAKGKCIISPNTIIETGQKLASLSR